MLEKREIESLTAMHDTSDATWNFPRSVSPLVITHFQFAKEYMGRLCSVEFDAEDDECYYYNRFYIPPPNRMKTPDYTLIVLPTQLFAYPGGKIKKIQDRLCLFDVAKQEHTVFYNDEKNKDYADFLRSCPGMPGQGMCLETIYRKTKPRQYTRSDQNAPVITW